MRRVKTTGHPSQKIAQAIQGSYHNPSDPSWKTRATDPSPNFMWKNAPIGPSQPLIGADLEIITFNDNADISIVDKWNQIKDALAVVPALVDIKGGGIRFNTGSQQYQSFNYIEKQSKNIILDGTHSAWILFNAGVVETEGSVTDYHLEYGITDALLEEDGDYAGFDNGVTLTQYNNYTTLSIFIDGGQTYNTSIDLNDDNYGVPYTDGNLHKGGMQITPNQENDGTYDIAVFFDDVLIDQILGQTLPTEALGVMIGSGSHNDQITLGKVITLQDK